MSERKELFRTEAIINYAPKKYGSTLIYMPISLNLFTAVFFLIFIAAAIFISLATFKTTVTVRGNLNSRDGNVKLYPPNSGSYEEILVTEGQFVEKGEILAKISMQEYNNFGIDKRLSSLTFYNEEVDHLKEQELVFNTQHTNVITQLRASIQGIEEELNFLDLEHNVIEQRIIYSDQNVHAQQVLFNNENLSINALNQHHNNHLGLLQQLHSLDARISVKNNNLIEVSIRLDQLPTTLQETKLNYENQLSQLNYKIREIENNLNSIIIAPFSGNITSITSTIGDMSNPREPLLVITPQNSTLEAVLYLPSQAVGTIQSGSEVLLTYDAFPFQVYGNYNGEIISISKTSVDPREHLFPVSSIQEPVYLAKVNLNQQYVSGTEVYQLQSDMIFTAEIVLAEMSIIEYIFEPILKLGRKL